MEDEFIPAIKPIQAYEPISQTPQEQELTPDQQNALAWYDNQNAQMPNQSQKAKANALQRNAKLSQAIGDSSLNIGYQDGLAQQQVNDTMFNNFVVTDSKAKADELNAKLSQGKDTQRLNQAELIQNRDAMLQITSPDKYEKNYYKPTRNTGIAYFDNKKELSILDAYIAKKYLGINVNYTFLKHDITADMTIKNKGQATAINRLAQNDKLAGGFVDNNMFNIISKLNNGNIPLALKQATATLTGRTIGEFGTEGIRTTNKILNEQMAQIAHKAGGGTDRASDFVRKQWQDHYATHRDVEADIESFKTGLRNVLQMQAADLRQADLAHLTNGELAGYQARLDAGKELLNFVSSENIKANPAKFVELYARYQGKSDREIKSVLPSYKDRY